MAAIIVAGGSGRRMGGDTPKQFMLLAGKPLLAHAIASFSEYNPAMPIIVVLPAEHVERWSSLCKKHLIATPHTVVVGGDERFHSVKKGLAKVAEAEVIAVHEGVRPLVSKQLIKRCFRTASEKGSAIPVIPLSSSVRSVSAEGNRAEDRSRLRVVQTPQCFQVDLLREAYEMPYDAAFTDDATLVERTGHALTLVDGDESNLKVTMPTDLLIAEALLRAD